jgi:hypothetical protein
MTELLGAVAFPVMIGAQFLAVVAVGAITPPALGHFESIHRTVDDAHPAAGLAVAGT